MLEATLMLGLNARAKRRRSIGVERPARFGGCVHPIHEPERETLRPRPGHHRGIVGAKLDRWNVETKFLRRAEFLQSPPQHLIGGDAAGNDEGRLRVLTEPVAIERHSDLCPVGDDLGDGGLKARAEIGHVLIAQRLAILGRVPSAVLRPASEKCGSGRPSIGRGNLMFGVPFAAQASTAGPPG